MHDLGLDRGALGHVVGLRQPRLGRFTLAVQAGEDRLQLPRSLRARFRDPLRRKIGAALFQLARSVKPVRVSARQRRWRWA